MRHSRGVRPQEAGECNRRWNCHACKSSFNVLSKTMFQGTHLPLQKWFCAIALIVNAKKSLSSCQLGRDLNMNQRSAWYMQQRIRAEMATKQGRIKLSGIIEADETYLGSRPRKRNKRSDDKPNPRGGGTRKTAVIGAVQRSGKVVAEVADDLSSRGVLSFIKRAIDPDASTLVTDESGAYSAVRRVMDHCVIRHPNATSMARFTRTRSKACGPCSSGHGMDPSSLHQAIHTTLRGRGLFQVQPPERRQRLRFLYQRVLQVGIISASATLALPTLRNIL